MICYAADVDLILMSEKNLISAIAGKLIDYGIMFFTTLLINCHDNGENKAKLLKLALSVEKFGFETSARFPFIK